MVVLRWAGWFWGGRKVAGVLSGLRAFHKVSVVDQRGRLGGNRRRRRKAVAAEEGVLD